jgi:hypothetical protein
MNLMSSLEYVASSATFAKNSSVDEYGSVTASNAAINRKTAPTQTTASRTIRPRALWRTRTKETVAATAHSANEAASNRSR